MPDSSAACTCGATSFAGMECVCSNAPPAAYTGDGDRMRVLMDEWEATAEIGWSRPLTVEEARCVLSALSEGVVAMTTAESERMRTVSRG
jgi:hypothetical protein